ncbi:MAG: class I SAM-dependent methyltransferase, partial [Bacteroidia bacterium]
SDTIETPVPEALEGSRIVCIDPQPRVEILTHADEHFAFYVEDLDAGKILNKIKSGDILFIDSSHVVATGGDVNFLFLEILPQLPAGVFIHIHDIFFPFDYPEEWVINERWGWNEQYLVHAFLMFNDTFEIIWPSHYMWVKHKDKINKSFRPAVNNYKPSSLWIKKIR